MSKQIEQIRARIEARMDNTDAAGDYDEYADGIVVGLTSALGIIDEVEKEHPIPDEEGKIIPKLREFLATATPEELEAKYRELEYLLAPKDEDADKEAEMAARRAYPYEGGTKGEICEASIPIFCNGFKAGIAYERERLMKAAPVADVCEMRGNTDTEYPLVLTLGFPRIPNIEYHGGKVRVIIEEIK